MKEKVEVLCLSERAHLPTYGTEHSAGADLYALLEEDIEIAPGETALIGTGIALALPRGTVGLIFARSGLATRRGLAPANKVGVIDSDYRGEIKVALHNHSNRVATVCPNERIAQLMIVPYLTAEFCPVDQLDETARGEGGFGSTGTL